MKIVGVLVLALIGIVALALVLIELLLRRWAAGEGERPSGVATSRNRHGEAGKGSWTLSPEVAKQRDPGFSSTQWSEMHAWAQSQKTSSSPISDNDQRMVLSLSGCDFGGTELSVVGGNRHTVGQPTVYSQEILCFGGSTTFCMEVRDSQTWSSELQRLLNQGYGNQYRVLNFGIAGAPGLDRVVSFRHRSLPKSGDISVFLFGDNDAGYLQWYPSRVVHRLLVRPLKRLERESPGRILLFEWLKREFAVFLRRRLAASTAKATIKAAEDAMRWANARGACVLFVLQPNIMTLARRDAWDTQIYRATAPNLFVMLEVAYRHYRDWMKRNPNVVSATHIFDDEKPSPYMGDWAHANSRGNELIANFVFDELKRRNLLKSERTAEVGYP